MPGFGRILSGGADCGGLCNLDHGPENLCILCVCPQKRGFVGVIGSSEVGMVIRIKHRRRGQSCCVWRGFVDVMFSSMLNLGQR